MSEILIYHESVQVNFVSELNLYRREHCGSIPSWSSSDIPYIVCIGFIIILKEEKNIKIIKMNVNRDMQKLFLDVSATGQWPANNRGIDDVGIWLMTPDWVCG